MRKFFTESPSKTRIREFNDFSNPEFIADVSVSMVNGSAGMTEKELSRKAAELLVNYLCGEKPSTR